MFIYAQKSILLRGLMLAGCLATLAGCGGSSHDSAADPAPASVPAAPSGLTATAGNAMVMLTWSISSDATNYNVKRATTSGGPYTQLASPASPSYKDSSAANGTTYFYVVSILDAAGQSANSAQVSATPTAPTPPVAVPITPAGLTAAAGNAQATLNWTASSGATSYHVKRATTSGGPFTQVAAPTTTSYTDTSLTNGTAYYYVVSALDSAGESANSAQVSATPAAPVMVPTTPTGLSANPGNAQASLTWASSSGATSYHVKRATTSGGPFTQVAAPTTTSYTDTSLTNGTAYYYVVSALDSAGESANSAQVSATPVAPSGSSAGNACGMQLGSSPVIFCDTFDAPAGIGNRSGDLNGNVWGVSRATGLVNFGGQYNDWNSTLLQKCDGTTPRVMAPNDIIICNGQVREASNDNNTGVFEEGTVTTLAMYPKQPFDFAGRTGTVSFDVSNDTAGNHAAWPEFWMSDLPVPAPFNHFDSWQALPDNGFGIRFAAGAPIGSFGNCPNGNNIDKLRWTVDSAVVVRGYVMEDTNGYNLKTLTVTDLDCVIEPSGPDQLNHVEIRISQNQIDVYATDAGVAATPATLKHIAVITNANLTLTRGFVWFEDVHYNADKGEPSRPSQREHTFAWDNVAFDGPFTYRDFSYDAPDNTAAAPNNSVNLAKFSLANQTSSWNVPNMPANPQAAAARVLFNFNGEVHPNPTSLSVIVNGNAHTVSWPYPDQLTNTWRTFAVTIPLTDLVAGTNVVQLGATADQIFSNVNLVLVDVPGGVPVLPGASTAYPVN